MGELDRAARDQEAILKLKLGDEFAMTRLEKLRTK
jgi:hypothetical protein